MKKQRLLIVDISNLIFRAFYAIRSLNTSRGVPVNAVYGFVNMFTNLIHDFKPDMIAACFDSKEPSFRKVEFPEYKANRQAPPEELIPQFPIIREFIETIKIPAFEMPGYEADDIIATIAKFGCEHDLEVLIVSGDKDLAQLVNDKVKLVDTMKNIELDVEGVIKKFGVTPGQIPDYLGLIGDSSDNIPGVEGIGPKTASDLLQKFNSIEELFTRIEELPKKQKKFEKLRDSLDVAMLSKGLATVKYDVPVKNLSKENLEYKFVMTEEFRHFLRECEFHKLEEKFFSNIPEEKHRHSQKENNELDMCDETSHAEEHNEIKQSYLGEVIHEVEKSPEEKERDLVKLANETRVLVDEEAKLNDLIHKLYNAQEYGFDTETDGIHYVNSKIVGFSFYVDGFGYYIPIRHDGLLVKQLDAGFVLEKLKSIFEVESKLVIGHNLKFDLHMLANDKIEVKSKIFDTMLAAYVLSASDRLGLDHLALKEFNFTMISYESLCGKGKDAITFDHVEPIRALPYATDDALIAYNLYKKYSQRIESEHLHNLYYNVELKLLPVLMRMERTGVKLDVELLNHQNIELAKDIKIHEGNIYKLAGGEFNVNSPKQLQHILFEKLKLHTGRKTKTGFSTDMDVLLDLSYENEIAAEIVKYRELTKLKSTYVEALPKMISPITKRLHTSFNQTVTATGRLSSSDPNLQNIPIKTKRGKEVRKAFICENGYKILAFDYSQIELRVMAHYTSDESLVKAFNEDLDVHSMTASEIFGVSLHDVDEAMRRSAKAINFGLIYGKTAFGLAEELGISRTEAQNYIDRYFTKYKRVKEFMHESVESAIKTGYAETILGRRRFIPELHSKNKSIRNNAERLAINTPIQGSAADLIKEAMISIDKKMLNEFKNSKMILQVHDELVFEIPNDNNVNNFVEFVKFEMENVRKLKVPLKVDYGVGENWLDL